MVQLDGMQNPPTVADPTLTFEELVSGTRHCLFLCPRHPLPLRPEIPLSAGYHDSAR